MIIWVFESINAGSILERKLFEDVIDVWLLFHPGMVLKLASFEIIRKDTVYRRPLRNE